MLCSSAGCTRPFSFVWILAPGFLSRDIFICHAKINSSTSFASTYRTVCWQNGWLYWVFLHITCRHKAGSKYRKPNNFVIALCHCCEGSGSWIFCLTLHPYSRLKAVFCNLFIGSSDDDICLKHSLISACMRATTAFCYSFSWQKTIASQSY